MKTRRRITRGSRCKAQLGLGPLLVVTALLWPSAAATAPDPVGMECSAGNTVSLEVATGQVYTPDGNSIFMWGYKLAGGSFQMPGPTMCVTEGDTVSVTLTNPAVGGVGEPVSIIFPGQTGVTDDDATPGLFAGEADQGGTAVTYTFTADEPGTYLYESGSDPGKQVQMGLYGALIVRPAGGADYAYNLPTGSPDPATRFDPNREYLLLLNEIDPALHRAVELGQPYNFSVFNDDYWQVNGRSFPDTLSENFAPWLPSQPYGALVQVEPYNAQTNPLPALIRYANAGAVNHPFHPHGNHLRVIARDGRMLRGPGGQDTSFEDFTRTIGSGQTYDLLFKWTTVDSWIDPGGDPVPVTIPGLQNLVFKDASTFYSGDPELGEKGTLPQGTTSYNECGEFYFPWHSHALQEFTNFDEGFGGLATLLRVDPAGGCP